MHQLLGSMEAQGGELNDLRGQMAALQAGVQELRNVLTNEVSVTTDQGKNLSILQKRIGRFTTRGATR